MAVYEFKLIWEKDNEKLIREKVNEKPNHSIRHSVVAAKYLRENCFPKEESWLGKCIALFLSKDKNVLGHYLVSVRSDNRTVVDLRSIVRVALLSHAECVIIAHNHPSGNPLPTQNDIRETKEWKTALNAFNLELTDRIILGEENFFSFRDEVTNIIPELQDKGKKVYTFAGLQISQGPVFFHQGKFVHPESFPVLYGWKINSYEKAFGKTDGSTYFNWDEVRDINLDGWRLPTIAEWEAITTTDAAVRSGSTVNGTENAHWAFIQLTGVSHAGSSNPYGLLLFPDGATITGQTIEVDAENDTTGVTLTELNEFLAQGCVFLPASGYYHDGGDWYVGGDVGRYWSGTQISAGNAWGLYFYDGDLSTSGLDKSRNYYGVRLIRD